MYQSITNKTEPGVHLNQLITIQQLQSQWMGELADRFKPFDSQVSDLLEDLSLIENTHAMMLKGTQPCCNLSTAIVSSVYDEYVEDYENRFEDEQHFFVTDYDAAFMLLLKAKRVMRKSLIIFSEIANECSNLNLRRLLMRICRANNQYEQIVINMIYQYRCAHLTSRRSWQQVEV